MSEIVSITLAGREFKIPPLPIKVVRKVMPRATRLSKLQLAPETLSDQDMDELCEIVFYGISFGMPQFKMDDLDSMVVDFPELIAAVAVVIMQCGGKKTDPKAAQSDPQGEAQAAAS